MKESIVSKIAVYCAIVLVMAILLLSSANATDGGKSEEGAMDSLVAQLESPEKATQPEKSPLEVKLLVEATDVRPREPVTAVITVRNTGKETIRYFPLHFMISIDYEGEEGRKSTGMKPWEQSRCPTVVHLGAGAEYSRMTTVYLDGVSMKPGVFQVRALIWYDGKISVDEPLALLLRHTANRSLPGQIWPQYNDGMYSEIKDQLTEFYRAMEEDVLWNPKVEEIEAWNGKVVSEAVEVRRRPLESEEDKKAFDMLTSGIESYRTWTAQFHDRWKLLVQLMKNHPKSIYAKYALYYLVDSEPFHPDVASWCNAIINDYEDFQFTDDAKLHLAKVHYERKDVEKAVSLLNDILKSHPGTSGAVGAVEFLEKIRLKEKSTRKSADSRTGSPATK